MWTNRSVYQTVQEIVALHKRQKREDLKMDVSGGGGGGGRVAVVVVVVAKRLQIFSSFNFILFQIFFDVVRISFFVRRLCCSLGFKLAHQWHNSAWSRL